MDTLVSAVVTTCRRPKEIVLRAVKSIIGQTYPHMEIIVVDDSGNDYDGREEVKKAVLGLKDFTDKEIFYFENETRSGACVARNVGLDNCHGEFVAFLDDDDEWRFDKIEKLISAFTSDAVMIYSNCFSVSDQTGERKVSRDYKEFRSGYIYPQLIDHNYIGSTSNPLIRTLSLKAIGGFDPLMRSAQDYDVWLRLSKTGEIIFLNEPLTIYHVHAGERITADPQKRIDGLERLNEKNAEYLNSHKKIKWRRLIVIIPYYVAAKERKKAWAFWWKCVALNPFAIKTNLKYLLRYLVVKRK